MSRLAALFHRDGRPVDAVVLQALIGTIRHGAAAEPRLWTGGRVGLAYQRAGQARPDTGRLELAPEIAFDGRLDNREELLDVLSMEREPSNALPDDVLVLAGYRRLGESIAGRLNGDFAFALWDDAERRLVLARDLVGVRPLDYWTSDRTFLAASEIKAILAHPDVDPRPDDEGLADALLGGNPLDIRRTCFRGVSRVVPGSTIVISGDGIREFRHRDFDPARQTRYGSDDEYAEVLRGLFKQAVRRRLPRTACGPVAVLVSGGLDSSAIFCQSQLLKEAGAPVAPTIGISWVFPKGGTADEQKNLDAIATQHDVAIHRVPFASIRLLDEERWLRTLEFPRLRWDSEAAGLEVARTHGCSAVLDGYFGDQMMSSDAPVLEMARRGRLLALKRELDALARSMLDSPPGMLRQEYLRMFLWELAPGPALRAVRAMRHLAGFDGRPRWYTARFRHLAYQRSQQARRSAGPFAGKHAELCHRQFVQTHRLNMIEELNKLGAAHGLERAYPFMDRDLVEFMMAIPGDVVNRHGTYKGLFRLAMRGVLPESIRLRYWKADFTAVANDAAATGYSRFRTRFERGCASAARGYLDRDIFVRQFQSYQNKLTGESIQPPSQVSAVVGLELWLRAFFGSNSHDTVAHAGSRP